MYNSPVLSLSVPFRRMSLSFRLSFSNSVFTRVEPIQSQMCSLKISEKLQWAKCFLWALEVSWLADVHCDLGVKQVFLYIYHFVTERFDAIRLHCLSCVSNSLKSMKQRCSFRISFSLSCITACVCVCLWKRDYLCGFGSFFWSLEWRIIRHLPMSPLGLDIFMPWNTSLQK